MNNVSFKGVYAIPLNDEQNPTKTNYAKLMEATYTMRDKAEKPVYSQEKQKYYIYIQDKNDKNFETLAKLCGIKTKKVDKSQVTNKPLNVAEKTAKFVDSAIEAGAKYSVEEKNGIKTVTLYDEDGKTIFGKYRYGKNGVINRIYSYVDGKISHINVLDRKTGGYRMEMAFNSNGQPICAINSNVLRTI